VVVAVTTAIEVSASGVLVMMVVGQGPAPVGPTKPVKLETGQTAEKVLELVFVSMVVVSEDDEVVGSAATVVDSTATVVDSMTGSGVYSEVDTTTGSALVVVSMTVVAGAEVAECRGQST
jgi:hypothetical protein